MNPCWRHQKFFAGRFLDTIGILPIRPSAIVCMCFLRLILLCHTSLQMTQLLKRTNNIIKDMHRRPSTSSSHSKALQFDHILAHQIPLSCHCTTILSGVSFSDIHWLKLKHLDADYSNLQRFLICTGVMSA